MPDIVLSYRLFYGDGSSNKRVSVVGDNSSNDYWSLNDNWSIRQLAIFIAETPDIPIAGFNSTTWFFGGSA
ncbi:hypothetical protein [Bartonella apis]|uniref:hypothetical protein n=1 Tax=Bartonella apis TaxID=1686310 RepID=UPI00242B20E6|nr:hypothetical protein [Bartonella apis]